MKKIVWKVVLCSLMFAGTSALAALDGFIGLTNGYFFDRTTGKPWVPHGIAYQTWNRPLGVWQTKAQIDYDLDEMVKMGANSIRVDFVWQHIEEEGDNQWKWDNYDYLVQASEARGLRIFALIGYQWPPNWFPDAWYTQHPPAADSEGILHTNRWQSDIINYEHPEARAQYAEWFQNVCSRYKNSKAIVAWIIGNESGYLGLWSGLLDGYDPESEAAFRLWSHAKYGAISNVNACWGTGYADFNSIKFVEEYQAYGAEGAQWADMVQWREDSIATFTAIGAKAAKTADTNHLIAYSTVGMQWGEEDWRYHAEDRGKITDACLATNAPVDFFAINNYPWSILGHESQNGQWGISYTKKATTSTAVPNGVPVLYSETGFTSSETMWPGMNEFRQGPLIRNALWESLAAGAIGTHIFAWHDRPYITDREKGFGILTAERGIKPAFWDSMSAFNLMKQAKIAELLMGSKDPKPDIAFLWTAAVDSQYNRYECEMQQIAGALERRGYEPYFINLNDLASGAYTNFKVIILPRNMRVDTVVPGAGKGVLRFLRENALTKGIHIMASADMPGMQDENGRPMADFQSELSLLFGVDGSDVGGFEVPPRTKTFVESNMRRINVTFTTTTGLLYNGYSATPKVWKYNDEVKVSDGVQWAKMDTRRNKGFEDNANGSGILSQWGTWTNTGAGLYVRSNWGWQYAGSNLVQMWGDACMWQDTDVVPFGRYTRSAYLRSNSGDPLREGAYASIGIEWEGPKGTYLGLTESARLTTGTSGGVSESPNLIKNPGFETNGANWATTGQLGIEAGFHASAAETGSYGAWITNNAGEHYMYQQIPTNVWKPYLGTTMVFRVRAKKVGTVPGNIKLELYHPWVAVTNVDITSALTTNWQTFALYYRPTAGSDQLLELRLRNATGGSNLGKVLYDNAYFSITNTVVTGDTWVKYSVDAMAPSNAVKARTIIRSGFDNLLANGGLNGSGLAPDSWAQWNDGSHDPSTGYRLGTEGNAWAFWWDGGIYQDVTTGFSPGHVIKFGGRLFTPASDRLRSGTKKGVIQVEFYNSTSLISSVLASPEISQTSEAQSWLSSEGSAAIPAGTVRMRVLVRCNDYSSGDGRFMADDIYLRNTSRGLGSVFVDNLHENPALVVKSHGAAKSAIFLFSAGDVSADGDGNGQMDVLPWKWRYDYFGTIVKDYFGVQPGLQILGTNAHLCMAEYRTCTNGATLWQIKNYMWDTNFSYGGPDQTFTIQSSLFNGRTIRAFEQGKVLYTNSNGTITLTLKPDGHEMLLAYLPGTNRKEVVQIAEAPSVVHPGGDKSYLVKIRYDALATTGLVVKAAFKEVGNNGDTLTNEIYAIMTNVAVGAAEAEFWMWLPPYQQTDTDYKSTEDGGKYEFAAWLERAGGVRVAEAVPVPTMLVWGVRPTAATPTNIVKGGTYSLPLEWEELYEPLFWQLTPMARNEQFPSRVAVFRSSKTENYASGQFARANAVCDWLESMGYSAGNPLDISFDNVIVSNGTTLLNDNFEDGDYNGWTRAAGCANWTVENTAVNHGQGQRYNVHTSYSLNTAAQRLSFKITADATKTIDRVFLYLSRVGTAPTYNLALYKDNAGIPGTSPLSSQTIPMPTTSYTWVSVDLPNYQWSAGSTYHFVLSYASGTVGVSNYVRAQYVGPNTDGRRVLYSSNSGSTWTTNYHYEPAMRVLYTDGTSLAQPYISYSAIVVTNRIRYGQQFRLPEAAVVTNIALFTYKQSTVNGDAQLQIRRWSDKALLASSTVSRTTIATTGNWVRFSFSPSVTLGASTQYFWALVNLGSSGNYYVARANSAGGYGLYTWDSTTNASVYTTNTGATWVANTDYDFGYRLQGRTVNKALRTSRIGNSDNLLVTGNNWTNYTVQANIRYNKQDNYFADAEVYFRYKDRANYYRVGIRNFYAFWRLKYTVVVNSNIVQQGWLYDFAKTNRPVENAWYNLKINCKGSTNDVYFNNQLVGTFWDTNLAAGKVAVGSRALQLGNWEPQKGYYFVDDDEWSFWAPEGQPQTEGKPVNLDPGYLRAFFNTMILPGVQVMSDIEVSNLTTWVKGGLNSIIATDGGVAMRNETGAMDLGRIEPLLGVGTGLRNLSGLTGVQVGEADHYATLDYGPGTLLSAAGNAVAYDAVNGATALGLAYNTTSSVPAFVANVLWDNPAVPIKVFTFNFAVDTQGQLAGSMKTVAQRAFEWARGNAFKCQVELRHIGDATNLYDDFTVYSTNIWLLGGSGSNSLSITLPTDGIMTGTNLCWTYTVYPWDATNSWQQHQGFYSSQLDAKTVKIPGKGLQLAGAAEAVFAGRGWETFTAYNAETQSCVMTVGVKDKSSLTFEDNFDDGNYTGWLVAAQPNVTWSVSTGRLRAAVSGTGSVSSIVADAARVGVTNLTVEYYARWMNGANDGGLLFRGCVLQVNPARMGWTDYNPTYVTNNAPVAGAWNHVVVHIRDGAPFLRSDLHVNGRTIFLDEPIELNGFATNTIGFTAPNLAGYAEWDNVRIADEHYEFVTQMVVSAGGPVNIMIPVPDYDAAMWEHEGTELGGGYEWFAYLAGQNVHSYRDTAVSFAPRFIMEDTNFPTVMNPGDTVRLPVLWENLPQVPMTLQIRLVEGWRGDAMATNYYTLGTASGSAYFEFTIPEVIASGGGYGWMAFVHPTGSAEPMLERLGLDDTFRYGRDGMPVEPEVPVCITPIVGEDYMVYRDAGIPMNTDIMTWDGGSAYFNGAYVTNGAPEGNEVFFVNSASWAGWGVIGFTGTDMREYRNGFVSFWLKSSLVLKLDVEDMDGVKATTYVPTTSNVWKQVHVPVTSITAAGVDLSRIKGFFEITAEAGTTFLVDEVKWVKGHYDIYNDKGFATNTTLSTSYAGAATFNANYVDGAAPEGVKSFMATGTSWLGWGAYRPSGTQDLKHYTNGVLAFWLRSSSPLYARIEGPSGTVRSVSVPSTTGTWREVKVKLSSFSGVDFERIRSPFAITSSVAAAYLVDDVRWMGGTNPVPSDARMTIYSDQGIPVGTDVQTWWSEWWLVRVSPSDSWVSEWSNGGFETGGAPIPSWSFLPAGGGATAVVSAASVYQGVNGLRLSTGSSGSDTQAVVYQQFDALEGDMFWAEAMFRQPAGQGWVAGSKAFVRVQFYNAWNQLLTNFTAHVGVLTNASQGWTECNNLVDWKNSTTVAPRDTRYARICVTLTKPAGATGVSVVDVDNVYFCLRSSYNGGYALDPVVPEGTKCFRTFSAGWAGWGVVSTNGTVDIRAYTNGYLKFWFKAPQVTAYDALFNGYHNIWTVGYDVQMQSVYNGVTNTVSYSEVTGITDLINGVPWYQVSIPVSAFTSQGLNPASVRAPFMITASMTTAWEVDHIRFELKP